MQAMAVIANRHQFVAAAADKALTHCGGSAKQIEQQPKIAAEIANQRKIALGFKVL